MKFSKGGEVIADVLPTVRQYFDRSYFQRHSQAAQEFLVPLRSTTQYVLIDEHLAAREIDLLNSKSGGGFQVRAQFSESDLL